MLDLVMETDIPATLQELKEMAEKLKALREWAKLAEEEARPGIPPSFQLSNNLEDDVRPVYAAFAGKALGVQISLNDPNFAVTPADKQEWHNVLERLQRQVRLLHLTESFIRP